VLCSLVLLSLIYIVADRVDIGKEFISSASNFFSTESSAQDAEMLRSADQLISNLIQCAAYDPNQERRINFPIGKKINLRTFLVPTLYTLRNVPLMTMNSHHGRGYYSNPNDSVFIRYFHDNVVVTSSKAKPKVLTLTTTIGAF
jgi:hypothetical protein